MHAEFPKQGISTQEDPFSQVIHRFAEANKSDYLLTEPVMLM